MSEAVSILNGAEFKGAVTLREAGLRGMITLRGDLADDKLAAAVKSATGLAMPPVRGIREGKNGAVAWMSPDELLLMVAYDKAEATRAKLARALDGQHALAVNVSDARATFTLIGEGVREVIAKGSPADLSESALPVGEIRRSRIGQIAAAYWLSDAQTMNVVCFRSVGAHLYSWLCTAATKGTLPKAL